MTAALGIIASAHVSAAQPPATYIQVPRTSSNNLRQSPDDNPTITNLIITARFSQDAMPPAGNMTICERWLTMSVGTNRFIFRIDSSARPMFLWAQAAATQTRTSTVSLPWAAGQWGYLRMTFTPNNGSSQHVVLFEISDDGTTWTTLDTVTTGGVASIDAGSGYLAVGGRLGSTLGLQGGISDLTIQSGASTLFSMHCATDLIGVDPVASQFRTAAGQTVLVNRSTSPQLVLVPPTPVGSAVRFSAAANRYTRAAFGLGAGDLTICYWLKLMVAQATYSFSSSVDNGGANYVQMGPSSTGVNLGVGGTTGGQATGYDLVVGNWVFFAQVWRVAGGSTDELFYGVGGANSLIAVTPSAWTGYNTASALWIGGDGFGDYFNGAVAAFKVWNTALTKTELEAEMKKYAAVRTANLYAAYRFLSGPQTADDSGNSRVLTQGATAPTTDTFGPPCT